MVTPATYPLWRLLELDHNSVHGDGWTEGGGGGLGQAGEQRCEILFGLHTRGVGDVKASRCRRLKCWRQREGRGWRYYYFQEREERRWARTERTYYRRSEKADWRV